MNQPNLAKIKERFNSRGFTLIEMMIAIGIFAIGFLAIGSMQIAASKCNRTGSEITQAATIATDQMERLMLLPFDDPDLDTAANPLPNPSMTQGKYNVQWIATDTDLDADGVNDAKVINLTVSWNRLFASGGRTVNIDFIKPDI
jgi:prepilin-type N-terminal cleavage/methylation domain-containing protein